MNLTKCWSSLPLNCAIVTFLFEWRVFERIRILVLGEFFRICQAFNLLTHMSYRPTRGWAVWDGCHNGLGERGKPDHLRRRHMGILHGGFALLTCCDCVSASHIRTSNKKTMVQGSVRCNHLRAVRVNCDTGIYALCSCLWLLQSCQT